MPNNIEVEFDKEMHAIYKHALEECGYRATRFLQLISELGGVKAAKHLLNPTKHSEGLAELSLRGRLDLSMEALVLKEPWCSLFTDSELAEARKRLK